MTERRKLDATELLGDLRELVESPEGNGNADLLLDMIQSTIKLMRGQPDRGDLKMLNQAFKELRYAFKVFAPYRGVRKVSIFGSARSAPEAPEYEAARAFANRMTQVGWMVITGAGSGIMEAAQGGAGRARSFGVNIRLPFEQKANLVIAHDPKLVNFKYFFTRKLIFVKETDAIALFPGKSQLLPIVFIDRPGGTYWSDWRRYLETHLRDRKLIDPDDMSLFHVTDDVDKAAETICRFYHNYRSARYVRSRLILRLAQPVSDALLERLNTGFADILATGRIERIGVLPEEASQPETHSLHRLALVFDRKSFGRLRQMIDVLNEPA
jgi:predicted Rossmann-fold nucleotide-binding protein